MDGTLRPVTGGGTWRPALRPLSGGTLGRSGAGSARWLTWAARLGGRYGGGDPAWDHLDTVLRHAAPVPPAEPGQTIVVQAPRQSITWPLNLTLHLTIPAARQAVVAPSASATSPAPPAVADRAAPGMAPAPSAVLRQVLPPAMQVVETTLARLHQREVWTNTHETELVTRLLTRQTRQEVTGVAGDWTSAVPAPARVFNQSPVAAPPAAAPVVPPPTAPPGLQYWNDAAPPPAAPTVDIGQLTDQVMRTMEDRVIAARERLGKR